MRRILITGAGGFIGRNLKEYLLAKKYRVFSPLHRELDLLNSEKVRKFILKNKIDIIIHAAIYGGGKEDVNLKDVISTNLRLFFNITRNSHLVEKIIYFGSGLEYDKSRSLKDIKEDDFDQSVPADNYGIYKYIVRKYIEQSKNIYDLVLFGIYGKYEDCYYKFISNSIVKNLLKMPIVINQNAYLDYLYIKDLCLIVEYFINHLPKYHVYNTTTGKKIDLVSIAKIINQVGKYQSPIKILKKSLDKEYTANNKRLLSQIPGLKFTPLKKAIGELYNWYEKNISRINVEKIKENRYLKFVQKQGSLYKSNSR